MPITEQTTGVKGVTALKSSDSSLWYVFRGSRYLGSIKLLSNGYEALPACNGDYPARVFNMTEAAAEYLATAGEWLDVVCKWNYSVQNFDFFPLTPYGKAPGSVVISPAGFCEWRAEYPDRVPDAGGGVVAGFRCWVGNVPVWGVV